MHVIIFKDLCWRSGLSYSTDETSLREAFSQHGEVVEARVILDRGTGRSRGFGFVTFSSTEAASSAIQAFDGQDLHGRRIAVDYANERPRTGGYGGGGFNYGQSGNYGHQGGGYQGGGYQGGGGGYQGGGGGYQGGGYQGGGYPRESSNFGGDGGFGGSNQYPSGGGGFGDVNNYPSGGGSSYTGGDSVQGGGSSSNYSAEAQAGFSGTHDESQDILASHQASSDAGNDEIEAGSSDENAGDKSQDDDNDDEPNDYADTKRS
ncbi:glycine-rich RNA-binding protein 1-like isoform X2 [Andrographis paniculata]|uniref:glycine-rich RNA-binding protein 1-like isoform X2 n=1 Tax=Andrographis paniculata TaxID=175694 RepID=UPI0021E86EE0|nr:glycine-rich RNA-binding protein 1-like isoform X2 [Andrographis paniculata]XP_051120082.1 glycine-rich RNA-binding protein 1-like isoform X2 [Andrographis paniculata]